MKSFWIRMVNLALIGVMVVGYNQVLEVRAAKENSAYLEAELETARLENELLHEALNAGAKEEQAEEESRMYRDGSYEGSAEGFGGPITVSVTVADDELTAIEILSADGEDGTFLDMGKGVIDQILLEQSTEVDAISGATFSSTGIKNAVKAALEQAA